MGKKADSKITGFLRKVRKKYTIEHAIFFGSRARGEHLKNSDYDIILVSPDFRGMFFTKRSALMYEFWRHRGAVVPVYEGAIFLLPNR
jgi:hypothetical protein